MIVCLCHAVNEDKIRNMIEGGQARSLRQLQSCSRAATGCGKCYKDLKEIWRQQASRCDTAGGQVSQEQQQAFSS